MAPTSARWRLTGISSIQTPQISRRSPKSFPPSAGTSIKSPSGSTPEALRMQSEFGDKREKEISGFDLIGRDSSISSDEIKVYDVILAGVCR